MKLIIRTQLIMIADNNQKETEVASDEKEIDSSTALTLLGNIPAPGQALPQPPTLTP